MLRNVNGVCDGVDVDENAFRATSAPHSTEKGFGFSGTVPFARPNVALHFHCGGRALRCNHTMSQKVGPCEPPHFQSLAFLACDGDGDGDGDGDQRHLFSHLQFVAIRVGNQ